MHIIITPSLCYSLTTNRHVDENQPNDGNAVTDQLNEGIDRHHFGIPEHVLQFICDSIPNNST